MNGDHMGRACNTHAGEEMHTKSLERNLN
jgi:hypothetical protein